MRSSKQSKGKKSTVWKADATPAREAALAALSPEFSAARVTGIAAPARVVLCT